MRELSRDDDEAGESEAGSAVVARTVDPRDAESGEGMRWLVMLAASFAVSAAVLAAYHFWIAEKPQRFAQIDMETVLKNQQKDFADLIAKGKGEAAYELASRMGPRMAQAMQALGRECGCVLLVGNAVVGEGLPDLTPRLQQLVSDPGIVPATPGGQTK